MANDDNDYPNQKDSSTSLSYTRHTLLEQYTIEQWKYQEEATELLEINKKISECKEILYKINDTCRTLANPIADTNLQQKYINHIGSLTRLLGIFVKIKEMKIDEKNNLEERHTIYSKKKSENEKSLSIIKQQLDECKMTHDGPEAEIPSDNRLIINIRQSVVQKEINKSEKKLLEIQKKINDIIHGMKSQTRVISRTDVSISAMHSEMIHKRRLTEDITKRLKSCKGLTVDKASKSKSINNKSPYLPDIVRPIKCEHIFTSMMVNDFNKTKNRAHKTYKRLKEQYNNSSNELISTKKHISRLKIRLIDLSKKSEDPNFIMENECSVATSIDPDQKKIDQEKTNIENTKQAIEKMLVDIINFQKTIQIFCSRISEQVNNEGNEFLTDQAFDIYKVLDFIENLKLNVREQHCNNAHDQSNASILSKSIENIESTIFVYLHKCNEIDNMINLYYESPKSSPQEDYKKCSTENIIPAVTDISSTSVVQSSSEEIEKEPSVGTRILNASVLHSLLEGIEMESSAFIC